MNCQSDEEVKGIFLNIFKQFHSKEQMQARSSLGKIINSKQEKTEVITAESRRYLKEFIISSAIGQVTHPTRGVLVKSGPVFTKL